MGTAARPEAPLARYRSKRDFRITPEPGPEVPPARNRRRSNDEASTSPRETRGEGRLSFVIQKHWASHLHYDFRLELDGVLLSWAVPKGPSYDPKQRRMAIQVEDHPVAYGGFEGTIPAKQYGAGEVIIWDNGTWTPEGDARQGLRDGKLVFRLHGQKLAGLWQLVRTSRPGDKRAQWLLIKKHDGWERPHEEDDVTVSLPDSVIAKPLGLAEARSAPDGERATGTATEQARASTSTSATKASSTNAGNAAAKPATKTATKTAAKTSKTPAAKAANKTTTAASSTASARTAAKRGGGQSTESASPRATAGRRDAGADASPQRPELPDLSDLSGARRAKLPAQLSPQLATLVSATPPGEWIAEAKFDGYRLMTRIDRGRATLMTRGGNDWTVRMPSLTRALESLGLDNAWLDGEIVVMREDGAPDFNQLQQALGKTRSAGVREADILYFLFDLPHLNGHDLREVPLRERRAVLRALLDGHGHAARSHREARTPDDADRLRFSEDFAVPPDDMLAAACQMRLEGLILKRPDAPYVGARSDSWVKLKCQQRQEFVVVGFTDRSDGSGGLGSLLLGYYEPSGSAAVATANASLSLRYAGRVGTGWSLSAGTALRRQLEAITLKQPHFKSEDIQRSHWARRATGDERWVQPRVVVEVAFAEWTPDGHVRHASFQGLREDKPAREIRRESATPAQAVSGEQDASKKAGSGKTSSTKSAAAQQAESATSPSSARKRKPATASTASTAVGTETERAMKPTKKSKTSNTSKPSRRAAASTTASATKATKASKTAAATSKPACSDLPADLRITHAERVIDPSTGLTKLDLVRYYAEAADWLMPHLARRPVAMVRAPEGVEGPHFFQKHVEGDDLIVLPSAAELLAFTQLNAVEFHTWNSQVDRLDRPDRLIFDLDPGEGVPWAQVREAALLVRALLRELGLASWLKTSGGKGLHVVVPLMRRHDPETCKSFSQAVVTHLAATVPQRFSAKSGPRNRVGKVFADYLRNGKGQTTVAAFSARARPGLGVSMTLDWDELDAVKGGDHWTIANAVEHLRQRKTDPWQAYGDQRQTLTAAIRALGD